MSITTIHEAKTNLSRLIEKAERGEEVIIARGKKPVVKLVPVEEPPKKRVPGLWKGKYTIPEAFFDPLPPEELEAWDQ
jgi:prevent-host-death family protein